ncbi:thioesterase family protein [Citricoccus sp. GCM10030269]|uniref:thioesterase family protein n=1 Tax=Citricoccus sp. GCM10030269 TaxID=3273388 RepID=UPI0036117EEA
MHLIFRTLLLLIRSRRRPPVSVWDATSLPLKALPTDIDIALHINNGMYFSLMDLGRFDLLVRAGFWDMMRRRKWSPVVQAEQIAFRRSINLWQDYSLETRVLGLDDKCIWIEQRFVVDGEISVRGYVASRFIGPDGPVSNEEILAAVREELGEEMPADLEVPEWLHDWRVNIALPGSRKPAPHLW